MIVGGVIGGFANWALNGCEFIWKGLGYFGVGALSGSASSGIGSGVSSMFGGGTFGAGFLGTASAKTASSSFISGATIGGFSGSFGVSMTSLGNSLINGKGFGKSLLASTKDGLIGGFSGGLLGGLFSGFSASGDGRDFWTGSEMRREVLADRGLRYVSQNAAYNCGPACAESASNGVYDQNYYRSLLGGDPNSVGIPDKKLWSVFSSVNNRPVEFSVYNSKVDLIRNVNQIASNMGLGWDYAISLNPSSSGQAHQVLLNRISKITKLKAGYTICKYIFHVMDPNKGQYVRASYNDIIRIFTLKSAY